MARLTAQLCDIGGRLGASVRSARSAWDERRGILLQLAGADGLIGVGEASPLPGYSTDSLDQCKDALGDLDWQQLVEPGADADALGVLRADPQLVRLPPAARFAVESAWLDLAAQRRGVSVPGLLGATPMKSIPLCTLIAAGSPAQAAEEARAARTTTLKLKIGAERFQEDLARLAAVREAVSANVQIRLDANGAWDLQSAPARLRQLVPFHPEFLEEPVAFTALPSLRDSPVPLALDESLQRAGAWAALRQWLPHGPCCAVVLKPMALGGFVRCHALAAAARDAGLRVTVSHLFDGPIGLGRARQLALVVADSDTASGLAEHSALAAYPPVERVPVPVESSGVLRDPATPGRGAESEQP